MASHFTSLGAPIPTRPFHGRGDSAVSAAQGLCLTHTIPQLGVPIPTRPYHGRGDSDVSAAEGLCLTRIIPPRGVPTPTWPFHGQGDLDVFAARGLCLSCAITPLSALIPTWPHPLRPIDCGWVQWQRFAWVLQQIGQGREVRRNRGGWGVVLGPALLAAGHSMPKAAFGAFSFQPSCSCSVADTHTDTKARHQTRNIFSGFALLGAMVAELHVGPEPPTPSSKHPNLR